MSRTPLPSVSLSEGIALKVPDYCFGSDDLVFLIIGLIGESRTPFWLCYSGGVTQWDCPERLGEPLRRKILSVLRETCRRGSFPEFLAVHDLIALYQKDREAAQAEREALELKVLSRYRTEYLKKPPEQWVFLDVPFAEKDQAKELGAVWDQIMRKWKVDISENHNDFSRWMPKQ